MRVCFARRCMMFIFPGFSGEMPALRLRLLERQDVSGNTAEGISWIEHGIRDYRATGAMLSMPYLLALKAEALYLADRTSEALEAISEAEALIERFDER